MRHVSAKRANGPGIGMVLVALAISLVVAPGCLDSDLAPPKKDKAADQDPVATGSEGQSPPAFSPGPPPSELPPPDGSTASWPTGSPPPPSTASEAESPPAQVSLPGTPPRPAMPGATPPATQTPVSQPPASPTPAAQAPAARIELSAGVALPQTGLNGQLMSFSVDYRFAQGAPDANVQYGWIIQRQQGQPAAFQVKLQERGTLQVPVPGWAPNEGPFRCYLMELRRDGARQQISEPADLETVGEG